MDESAEDGMESEDDKSEGVKSDDKRGSVGVTTGGGKSMGGVKSSIG